MSGTTISALPAASSVLSTDLVPVVELGTPNVTKRANIGQVLSSVLPLAGGKMTGPIELSNNVALKADD